jgi:signal transduction histidine kinase/CheY-like chemotaxis protein
MEPEGTGPDEPVVEVGLGVRGDPDAETAAREAARAALGPLRRNAPSVLFAFAPARWNAAAVARGLGAVARGVPVVGATTAAIHGRGGAICDGEHEDAVAVAAVGSPYLAVRVGVGEDVSRGWQAALDQALATPELAGLFDGTGHAWRDLMRRGRSAFAFLSSPGETIRSASSSAQLVEALKRRSLGMLPIFGGSSACDGPDDANHVFGGGRAVRDGLVVAVFETELRFGIALAHGFRETSTRLTVTRCRGEEVLELDGRPAAHAYAEATGVPLEALRGKNPTDVTGKLLGSQDASGQYVPYLARTLTDEGGVLFSRAVTAGMVLTVLLPDPRTGVEAGPAALRTAALRAGVVEPALAVVAACPTRFRLLGDAAAEEVPRMVKAIGGAPLIGFRSWGEQGVTDAGVSSATSGVIAALVLGKELSVLAQAARETERLRVKAERLQRRAQEELEQQVAERTAQLLAANEERARMVEQLMQADRLVAMGRLAAGVGHEINNPLTYVLSGLEAASEELEGVDAELPQGRLDAVRQNFAEVREGLDRIRQAVRDLRTFSRPDTEPLRPVAVEKVLEVSLQMAANEIRHRALLVRDFAGTPPVLANEARLGQVFLNLLVNAAQAIPDGDAARNEIRVRTSVDPFGQVVVEVRDTGRGIRREHLERIFEPFFTTRQTQGGTGLGLSISRNLVSAMGGCLTVESEVGKGSRFQIHLPPAASADAVEAAPPPPVAAPRVRVLVLDDEPLVLNAVRRTLAREHDVVGETSARAALARIDRGERFDVVVCDLMMPDMCGAEFHGFLAASRPELAARTVFLTGGAFTAAARAFVERVPNPCLEKPFDAEALLAQVGAMLGAGPS